MRGRASYCCTAHTLRFGVRAGLTCIVRANPASSTPTLTTRQRLDYFMGQERSPLDVDFVSDSNSHDFSFSRRKASEVCQSLANPSEGVERREAPGHQRAPLEAGLTYPPRAARHRARPRQALRLPALHLATRPSTVPGRPGSGQLSLYPNPDRLQLESGPSSDRTVASISSHRNISIGICRFH
jgi:hypothetical protein